MPESESLVVVTVADGIGRLRLNRADKRNALNEEMSGQVLAAIQQLELDDDAVCIVIEGTDGAFCAGADMAEANAAYEAGQHRFNPSAYAAAAVGSATKPTIAAIDGPAYGAGALLGFADPDEKLGFSYVCNQAGRSWRDPRNIALIDATYASI